MYHAQVSWWRRGRVDERPTAEPPERSSGGDHADATAVRLSLQQALMRLTPRQRAVLVLRFYEDRTEYEAAELLGCAVGTVKSQTAKALDRLRKVAPELLERIR